MELTLCPAEEMVMILYPIETCPEDPGNKNTTENQNETKKTHLNLMFHFFEHHYLWER